MPVVMRGAGGATWIYAYDEDGRASIVKALGLGEDGSSGFFCTAFKDPATRTSEAACRAAIESLIESLSQLDTSMIEIDGDYYGSQREVILYVSQGNEVLRLAFDIWHET